MPVLNAPPAELLLRIGRLSSLLDRVSKVPDEWLHAETTKDRIEAQTCTKWETLEQEWAGCTRWRDSIGDVLSAMLAVALSTSQTGNQLFLLVVAPAGSLKSQLCDGMLTSSSCFVIEHLTGFHSGAKSDDGRDLSLLSRVNHKTMITPEGDVLVASKQFAELMSQVRRIFDGKSSAIFKTSDEDKRWDGLRTPWIIAGTPFMIDYWDQSRLGDRFLRIHMDDPDNDERRKIVMSAMNSEWEAVAEASTSNSGGIESRMRKAYALTGGYVNWLRDNSSKIDEVTADEWVRDRIADLAEFTADMRAKPNLDVKKSDCHDTKELPTRIGRQLIRLARCMAVVLNKTEVDQDVMRRVHKVAVDSARGKTLDMLRWFRAVDSHTGKTYQESNGIMAIQMSRWANFKEEKDCLAYLNFLRKINVLEHVDKQYSHGYWLMTPRMDALHKSVVQ